MHKSQLGAIIIDCQAETLPQQANFWSHALGLKPGRSDERYIHLEGRDQDLEVTLQQVEHPSRVHIDIETDDIDAEVKRLQALGAIIVEKMERWVVMEAPSKHRFCIINAARKDFESNANVWE
jgi:hypothetical protein